jgi:hypothetical protein
VHAGPTRPDHDTCRANVGADCRREQSPLAQEPSRKLSGGAHGKDASKRRPCELHLQFAEWGCSASHATRRPCSPLSRTASITRRAELHCNTYLELAAAAAAAAAAAGGAAAAAAAAATAAEAEEAAAVQTLRMLNCGACAICCHIRIRASSDIGAAVELPWHSAQHATRNSHHRTLVPSVVHPLLVCSSARLLVRPPVPRACTSQPGTRSIRRRTQQPAAF